LHVNKYLFNSFALSRWSHHTMCLEYHG
jgi:hypothetical protein